MKILLRNERTGLFEDYNGKDYDAYKVKAESIISQLDMKGVTVSAKNECQNLSPKMKLVILIKNSYEETVYTVDQILRIQSKSI